MISVAAAISKNMIHFIIRSIEVSYLGVCTESHHGRE
jgi:hypothetical protein